MILQMIVGIADIAMVGRLGADELAAVGLGRQLVFVFQGLISGLSVGTTALIARYIGAKEKEKAVAVGEQSLIFGAILSLAVGAVGVLYGDSFLRFLGATPTVVSLGYDYLQLMFAGMFTVFITFAINAIFRGAGDTKTPMYIMGFINLMNVILNYFLIFGIWKVPFFGVRGAAMGTVISRSLGTVVGLYLLLTGIKGFKLQLRPELDFSVVRKIVKVGLPASTERIINSTGGIAYTAIVVSFGTIAVAAHQVAIRSESFSFMPGFGFAIAATTLVGQNLGAKKPKRAERCAYESLKLSVLIMSFMGILFFVFPEYFAKIFTTEPGVISKAVPCLMIIAVTEPMLGTLFVLAGSLRGAGDTRSPMIITAASLWLVRIPMAYFLGVTMGLGLTGAWIAMSFETAVRGALIYMRFRMGKWKMIKV